ncbi:hypothetical protein VII00023_22264 [Vibrio ichthyoenteri ATCC 700023]|uniref:Uncharacterized protein n=2 Tax=Vibrio ichthyoenteri TaxID=142461 RepID=F9S7A5_9VIBR|nr:hypothetical protein VII00023_22264 [Vibrio ichthyoenteri ATCC 700023]
MAYCGGHLIANYDEYNAIGFEKKDLNRWIKVFTNASNKMSESYPALKDTQVEAFKAGKVKQTLDMFALSNHCIENVDRHFANERKLLKDEVNKNQYNQCEDYRKRFDADAQKYAYEYKQAERSGSLKNDPYKNTERFLRTLKLQQNDSLKLLKSCQSDSKLIFGQ